MHTFGDASADERAAMVGKAAAAARAAGEDVLQAAEDRVHAAVAAHPHLQQYFLDAEGALQAEIGHAEDFLVGLSPDVEQLARVAEREVRHALSALEETRQVVVAMTTDSGEGSLLHRLYTDPMAALADLRHDSLRVRTPTV